MPRELTPQEMVVFQEDTDYLNAGIPVFGSRVATWKTANNMVVLIYHTQGYGYVLTDITDFGPATIAELAKQSEIQGMWYYLPQAFQEIVSERAEQVVQISAQAGKSVAEITQFAAKTIGQTAYDLLKPVVDALFVPLVLTGIVLGIYLIKKG